MILRALSLLATAGILTSSPALSEPPKTSFPSMMLRMTYGIALDACTGQRSVALGEEPIVCMDKLASYRAQVAGEGEVTPDAAAQSLKELRAEAAEENASDPEMLAKIDAVFTAFFAQNPSALPSAEGEVQRRLNE